MKYNSQYRQDYVINKLFKGKMKGFFIECGAHDGIHLSNSLFFEKEKRWNGICIEPLPDAFEKLKKNRNCTLVNGALNTSNEQLEFKWVHGTEQLSGAVKFREEAQDVKTEQYIAKHGGYNENIKVEGFLLSSILDKNEITEVDYFSLDIEGGEFEILQTIDFSKYCIKSLTVENNFNTKKTQNLLKGNGYKFLFKYGKDEFYVLKGVKSSHLFLSPLIVLLWLRYQLEQIQFLVRMVRRIKKIIK